MNTHSSAPGESTARLIPAGAENSRPTAPQAADVLLQPETATVQHLTHTADFVFSPD